MRLRDLPSLGTCLLALGCHSLLDLDVSYEECVDVQGSRYAESFSDTDLQGLRDRCWRVDNAGVAPSGIEQKLFVEDGDLVMRVEDPAGAKDQDQWTSDDQAPLIYRRLEGDFLVVVRAEASTKANGDHCLPAGNAAGLAVRKSDAPQDWATWTVEPYLWNDGTKQAECKEDADATNDPTATVRLGTAKKPAWPEASYENVGVDGEADIAVCRVDGDVYYLFGKATGDPTKNEWRPATSEVVSHAFGAGPLDVGLTTTGTAPKFEAAGHFNWVVFERGKWGDGCSGALERFSLPEEDP